MVASTPDDADAAQSLAIAEAIDPGELAPLSDVLPAWVRNAVGVSEALPQGDASALLRASQEALSMFETASNSGEGTDALLRAVMAVARAAVLAESAAAHGEAGAEELAVLARVYRAIDIPLLADERNLFVQLLQVFVAAAKTEGHTDDADAAHKLAESVFMAVRRAGPLHRRTVARLLRLDPHHAEVPQSLLAVGAALQGEDDALAIRAGELAVRLAGDAVTVKQLLAFADLCHHALQSECGGRALAKARMLASRSSASDPDAAKYEKWIAASSGAAQLAERVKALGGADGLEARLERAVGLMDLKRPEEGRESFEALRREYPGDARPVGGLARYAVDTRLDLAGANQIIDAAGVLANGDAAYYELAIGTRATSLLAKVIPAAMGGDWDQANRILAPIMARMDVDVRAYEALGHSDGRFLRFVFALTSEALPLAQRNDTAALTAMMRDALPRAVALVDEIDDNPHAYRLMLSATQFSRDRDAALRAASRPAPSGASHDALIVRRVQGLVDLAVTWNDPRIAEALDLALQQGSPHFDSGAAAAIADARAVCARVAGRPLGRDVVASYEAVVDDPATNTSAQALNNLAVARAEAGDLAAAIPLWERAAGLSEGWSEVATLNLAIKRPHPDVAATLRRLADKGSSVDIRLAAQAWLVSLAPDARTRKKAARALAVAVAKESRDHVRPVLLPQSAGVVLEGTLNAGLGYATKAGLSIELDTAGIPWLTFAPPTRIVDPRRTH